MLEHTIIESLLAGLVVGYILKSALSVSRILQTLLLSLLALFILLYFFEYGIDDLQNLVISYLHQMYENRFFFIGFFSGLLPPPPLKGLS